MEPPAAAALTVCVSLPSGQSVAVPLLPGITVGVLKQEAERSLEVGWLALELIGKEGQILDTRQSLEEAELHDGDVLTALLSLPKLAASTASFAVACKGGVFTWGDIHSVQPGSVRAIRSSESSFAAIRLDGSVMVWGKEPALQDELKDVREI